MLQPTLFKGMVYVRAAQPPDHDGFWKMFKELSCAPKCITRFQTLNKTIIWFLDFSNQMLLIQHIIVNCHFLNIIFLFQIYQSIFFNLVHIKDKKKTKEVLWFEIYGNRVFHCNQQHIFIPFKIGKKKTIDHFYCFFFIYFFD